MHEVALAYIRFDGVAGITLDSIGDLRMADAYNQKLIGPVLRSTVPSLGVIDAANQITQAFLETDAEWIFWLDCDMGLAPNTLDDLMFAALRDDLSAVSALTFKYQQTAQDGLGGFICEDRPVIMNWGIADNGEAGFMCRRNYPENTLIQCQATGMACVLINRRVHEAIEAKFGPGGDGYPADPTLQKFMWGRHGGWHSPFPAPPDAAMDVLGPDISFWTRAALCDKAFMPFVHTGIVTDHQKTTWRSHNTFVAQEGDSWRAESPGAEYRKPNRAERRAAKKLGTPEPFRMDTPGLGGVPLPEQ